MNFTIEEMMRAVEQLSPPAMLELERNLWKNRAEGVGDGVRDEDGVEGEEAEA